MNNWNTLQVTLSIEFQPSSAGRASEEIYSHPRTEIWQHKVVNQQSSMPLRYQIRPHVINDEVFNGLLLLYAGGEFGSRENQIATIDFEINLKETNLFVSKDCNISYNTCLTVVMELLERTDENGKKEYKKWERNMAERVQQTQTLEERMSPLREIINQLKNRQITSFSEIFPQYSPAELTAALALFEEYELLKLFLKSNKDKDSCLNSHVRSQFAWWQPTPLYFITGKNQQAMMKDCCKMLRFLQQHGANPNIAAEDGSTPLWNQTTKNGSVEVLKTLLEIGADPNGLSHEDECDFYPLASCLLPDFDKDGNSLPYEADALEKAKLLLEHGADPNLAIPELSDEPPLVMAIIYGKGSNILPIINLLLEKGANPDFVDSEGKTPLQIATENNLPEVMQLLLKTPFLKITVDDEYTEEYTKNDILHFNYLSDFDVRISERTATSFKGSLYYDSDHNDFPSVYETFAVDAENPVSVVNTGIMTISRMENYKFKFELLALENPKLPVSQELSEIEKQQTPPMPEKFSLQNANIQEIIEYIDKKDMGAMIPRPATDEDIALCQEDLAESGFPPLPADYVAFLQICNGAAFNGVELHGTDIVTDNETNFQLIDIVSFNEDIPFLEEMEYLKLLFFGRSDEDIFTYNPETQKYEARDITGFDIWDDYDTFEAFFKGELKERFM